MASFNTCEIFSDKLFPTTPGTADIVISAVTWERGLSLDAVSGSAIVNNSQPLEVIFKIQTPMLQKLQGGNDPATPAQNAVMSGSENNELLIKGANAAEYGPSIRISPDPENTFITIHAPNRDALFELLDSLKGELVLPSGFQKMADGFLTGINPNKVFHNPLLNNQGATLAASAPQDSQTLAQLLERGGFTPEQVEAWLKDQQSKGNEAAGPSQ